MNGGKDKASAITLAAWDDDIDALERVIRVMKWSPEVARELADRLTSITESRDALVAERRARGKHVGVWYRRRTPVTGRSSVSRATSSD